MKKKNKVGRPRKVDKNINVRATDESGLTSTLKPGVALDVLKALYDKNESRFLRTDGLDGVNEELKGKVMIKDNTLFSIELDLINKRKEELETTLDEIRKLQRKTETLTLQIKWLESGLERWTKETNDSRS